MNNPTPSTPAAANRLHIAILGRRNSGKSTLLNSLTGQNTAITSPTPGTTTDPVTKAIEMHPIGPCLLIDTPGFDDEGELGILRVERTRNILDKTDIALLLCDDAGAEEQEWLQLLAARKIPVIPILNKADIRTGIPLLAARIESLCGEAPIIVSAGQGTGMDEIRRALLTKLPADFGEQTITGHLAKEGDVVLLVMPQDIQAPRGRLILPQVQTIRELLDKQCTVVSTTTLGLPAALRSLAAPPQLIITDSQAFAAVRAQKPAGSLLTSFSVLFAAYKGDIGYYVESAAAIGRLTARSRVLIAEACTHAPLTEDIGRVKLPRMLRSRAGEELQVDIVAGADFPTDLSPYDLVIHCGACMFNRKHVLSRIALARGQHVPMTNYGVAMAYINGILDEVSY